MNIENNVPFFTVGDNAVYLIDEPNRQLTDLDIWISTFRNVNGFESAFNGYVNNLRLVGE